MAVPSDRLAFTDPAIQHSKVWRNFPLLLSEFDVPICEVDEVTPTVVDAACKGNIHEGTPFRPFGLFEELHLCLMRKSIPFAGIAGYA